MLDSIVTSSLDMTTMLILCLSAMVLGGLTSLVYMKTGRYTKSFVSSLAALPLITTVVILVVNGNLGTGIAVAGAFSLVRFRSNTGSAREILAIFLAMSLGLCLGGGYLGIAVLLFVFCALMVLLLQQLNFGREKTFERQLKISIPETLDYTGLFDETLKKYTESFSLERVRTTDMGSMYELTYQVTLPSECPSRALLDEIRTVNGNLPVSVGRVSNVTEAL
ncbi:MAG: DUF4956 domain-containing protein [Clostridia bacterium]|nr:DUF4956 domain-containing protein [Clostridia bacterium]